MVTKKNYYQWYRSKKTKFSFIEMICIIAIGGMVLTGLASCKSLAPQRQYEIVFAYPTDQPLPDLIEKSKIGCATSMKDILKGETVTGWIQVEMEKCRRLRGFTPIIWIDPIDVFFRFEYQKRAKKKKK